MVEILKKKLNMKFDEAVQHIEKIVQEEKGAPAIVLSAARRAMKW